VRALGVNVAGGVLYLAAVDVAEEEDELGRPVQSNPRLQPNTQLDDAHKVADVRDRFAQDLRAINPDVVGVVGTRQHSGLAYKNAFIRVSAISAVLIACVESNKPCREIKTEDIGRLVLAPAKALSQTDPAKFGLQQPVMYWTSGLAEAYGAAAVLLSGSRAGGAA
jgi:hypothetical protein